MPWYSVTISSTDVIAGRDTALESAFLAEFINGCGVNDERNSTASLWWSHSLSDGSVTYFLSARADEVAIESIAAFSPIECREPDFSAVKLRHTLSPLTTEGS